MEQKDDENFSVFLEPILWAGCQLLVQIAEETLNADQVIHNAEKQVQNIHFTTRLR